MAKTRNARAITNKTTTFDGDKARDRNPHDRRRASTQRTVVTTTPVETTTTTMSRSSVTTTTTETRDGVVISTTTTTSPCLSLMAPTPVRTASDYTTTPVFKRNSLFVSEDTVDARYVVVSGGSVSGLGKGTAISSLGVVLKSYGYRVTAIKIDPYLNVDAGTMSPYEHGEVYVLDDGGEADLDLGNYERFLDITLSSAHNITSGKIYEKVIKRERTGDYLGKTVQMIPHVTDAVQDWILQVAAQPTSKSPGAPHICLIELGGTVGDIESAVYLEALQQFQHRAGIENVCMIHVGLVPVMGVVGEQKTKPCQHSVKLLREAGIKPDFLFCRSEQPLHDETRAKLALFCQTPEDHVISLHDVANVYKVPLMLDEQNVGKLVLERLHLDVDGPTRTIKNGLPPSPAINTTTVDSSSPANLTDWRALAEKAEKISEDVVIGVVGKYTGLQDSYLSVIKSLKHASIDAGVRLVIEWIEASDLEPNQRTHAPERYDSAWKRLKECNGILCPGGFGDRGIEGKALCARYCRETNTPYFGICLGLQTAVISYCRDVLGLEDANSAEFDPSANTQCCVFMPEVSTTAMGGTMRLGSRVTIIKDPDSLAYKLYGGQPVVYERHRHRYEVNPQLVPQLEAAGMRFVGIDERGQRMEIAEIPSLDFFLCTQFHPEFKSRPMRPSPPFLGFVLAASGKLSSRLEADGGFLKPGCGWLAHH
ncbi:hypothetical protein FOZ62_022678 [Perkinsus olseni]|uniref:CTP synthase n=1 Tax=Perkinsus olseni TaxID=32597 RepID=A0A7J6SCN4_PEROL|nr:hypothetical protein FOZ62_022678 [Perkinsus olseni]